MRACNVCGRQESPDWVFPVEVVGFAAPVIISLALLPGRSGLVTGFVVGLVILIGIHAWDALVADHCWAGHGSDY